MKKIINNKGLAMVELIICLPVVIIIFFSIQYLSDLYIIKAKTLVSSRYAAWHHARYPLSVHKSSDDIEDNIKKYFFEKDDSNNLKIEFGEDNISIPSELSDITDKYFNGLRPKLIYGRLFYKIPIKFGPFKINLSDNLDLNITSEHYVTSNSWNGWENNIHDHLKDKIIKRVKYDLNFLIK